MAQRQVQPQCFELKTITKQDLSTVDRTNELNDNIMETAFKLLLCEFPILHVVSPKFMTRLLEKNGGWKVCERWFQPEEGQLRQCDMILPNRNALILIFPIFTEPTRGGRWTLLIRDARGVGLERARWWHFDTLS